MAKGLTVKIRADASQFDKTMFGVRRGLNNVAGPLKAVGVAAAAAGAAIVGAGVAAGVLVKNLILVGEGANTASARTANAVKQMGIFGERSAEVAARLDEVATATALQTGIDKKSIQMTQAKLATFKELLKSADQQEGVFDRVTLAAINLAAAGFGSAEENAVQLGKAFSDVEAGLTALKRAGTLTRQEIEDISQEFARTGDQGKAFERVLKALEVQSKNAAGATADGTKRIGTAWQLVKEEIGKPIADAFSKFADDIAKNTPKILAAIENMKPKIQEAAAGVFTAFSDALQGDMQKLTMIGEIIGSAIGAGMKAATYSAWQDIGNATNRFIESIGEKMPLSMALNAGLKALYGEEAYNKAKSTIQERERNTQKADTQSLVNDILAESMFEIKQNYSALMEAVNMDKPTQREDYNFVMPTTGYRPANQMPKTTLEDILKNIERNTRPTLFPSQ